MKGQTPGEVKPSNRTPDYRMPVITASMSKQQEQRSWEILEQGRAARRRAGNSGGIRLRSTYIAYTCIGSMPMLVRCQILTLASFFFIGLRRAAAQSGCACYATISSANNVSPLIKALCRRMSRSRLCHLGASMRKRSKSWASKSIGKIALHLRGMWSWNRPRSRTNFCLDAFNLRRTLAVPSLHIMPDQADPAIAMRGHSLEHALLMEGCR